MTSEERAAKFVYPATLLCDFYKVSHKNQYPKGTELVYSTWTPRTSRITNIDKVVAFGFQAFIHAGNELVGSGQTGLVRVAADEEGNIKYIDNLGKEQYAQFTGIDLLQDVFVDGKLVREYTLSEIRTELLGKL